MSHLQGEAVPALKEVNELWQDKVILERNLAHGHQ